MKPKKIAIVHDWLVTKAGAEKVLKSICEIYKDADIFSLVDFLNDTNREIILGGKSVKTSFIQNLPFAKSYFRNYLPFFPTAIESLNLKEYDVIISSSWAVAKGIKKSSDQLRICYCHTPIRYAWDLYDEYTFNLKQPKKYLVEKTLQYIRKWDTNNLDNIDYFIANSHFVSQRIKRLYKRDSVVMYPPVDVYKFAFKKEKEDFYLTASRLVSYKKTKLIVEAFNEMLDKKLVVIGSGEELDSIKKIAKPNITVLGYQEDDVLIDYMQRAKGFMYSAVEDFGIIPIEAMACGTPVIALNEGGTKETVRAGLNGVHFETQDIEAIIDAVERFEVVKFNSEIVRKTTMQYLDFKNNFEKFVNDKIDKMN